MIKNILDNRVFAGMKQTTVSPDPRDEAGFDAYMDRFVSCLDTQKSAVKALKA